MFVWKKKRDGRGNRFLFTYDPESAGIGFVAEIALPRKGKSTEKAAYAAAPCKNPLTEECFLAAYRLKAPRPTGKAGRYNS